MALRYGSEVSNTTWPSLVIILQSADIILQPFGWGEWNGMLTRTPTWFNVLKTYVAHIEPSCQYKQIVKGWTEYWQKEMKLNAKDGIAS